jgi:hypothetical protein
VNRLKNSEAEREKIDEQMRRPEIKNGRSKIAVLRPQFLILDR